jgi:hypothetical protein
MQIKLTTTYSKNELQQDAKSNADYIDRIDDDDLEDI